MSSNEELDEGEILERYIILLLGIIDKPIPSLIHLQKEIFILSQANPTIQKFINFEKHYYGPYSQDINEIIQDPLYYKDAFNRDQSGRIAITPRGKEIYNQLIDRYKSNKRFLEFLAMIKMTRELYDKLTSEEFLLLIYITYEKYIEKSKVSKEILSKNKRIKLARNLLKKGIITENRFNEMVNYSTNS